MVERKTPFRGKREYVTFGDGFPGFGETDECKASRWNADLFEEAPVSEPDNAPAAYTGDEDFPTRGRYSGVGIIVDEGADFDPEPASCDGAKAAAVCESPAQVAPAKAPNPLFPQAILGAPLSQTSPNMPHLSRPSSTSRCFASCIEAVMGGSCSSSIVRLAISLPSTHRSWCRERVFFGGSSCSGAIDAFRRPSFNRTNSSRE